MASSPAPDPLTGLRLWPAIILLWVLISAVMAYGYSDGISDFLLPDPDDALRLVQVRDLLGGQAFYDLTQYRINTAAGGGQLHWSRFIDVQIAGLILLFQWALPAAQAERWAVAIYPLLLLLPLLLLFARILARLGDRSFVLVGLLVAATTFSFLHYFVPMRIDHHGWQLLLSLAMLWLALGPASFARGLAAALVIAMHVELSLEGLPYLVIFGGLFALDWLWRPESAPRLMGFALGLAVIPLTWISLWRGLDAVTGVYCDAFSRPYLAGSVATGLAIALGLRQTARCSSLAARLGVMGVAAAVGGAAFLLAGHDCLAGPFAALSPLVREYWYEGISEGRPIWELSFGTFLTFVSPSAIGLAGIAWTWRRLAGTPLAEHWLRLLLVALGSFALSLTVLRTTAVTHAFVLAGYVPMVIVIFRRGQSLPGAALRIPVTTAAVLATPITVTAVAIAITQQVEPTKAGEMPTDCITPAATERLAELPPATLFTPLDISPALLVGTQHRVIASGHHRNHRAMHRVIAAFMAPPDKAERLIRETGATMVAVCRNLPEYHNFVKHGRGGLAAMLDAGTPPLWLQPDAARSVGPLRLYRVTPE